MGSYSATCEIVEANDRLDSVKYPGGAYRSHSTLGLTANRKPPDLKPSSRDALDDDINKLFEAISLKNSSTGFVPLAQAGSGTNNLAKQAMKRPIAASMPQSPRISGTDPVSLKQALRDRCISKASEMAAMKRLSKPSASPGPSESGRKKNLYDPAVVGGKRNFVDVLFVPEESTSKKYGKNIPLQLRASGITNLSKSLDLGAHSSTRFKSPNQSTQSSPGYAVPATQCGAGTSTLRNEFVPPSRNFHNQASKSPIRSALSSPRFASPKQQNTVGTSVQPSASSTSRKVGNQPSKSPTNTANSSPRKATPVIKNGNSTTTRDDYIPASRKVGTQAAKTETPPKERHCPAASQSHSDSADKKLKSDAVPTSKKVANKASVRRKSRLLAAPSFSVYAKGRLQTAPTFAIHGNRVGKLTRSNSRSKPALRNRSFGKKKTKLVPASDDGDSKGGNENCATSSSQLVCHNCHCALKNATEDSNQNSSSSFPVGHEVDASTSNTISASCEPIFSESNPSVSRSAAKMKKNSNSKDKGGFSQSSKSSLGDFSTSTSNSEESTASRPSCGNKPHMSQDIRWEAIRHVKRQDGSLSLRHFNLLKKLGCGDIGTVYLAELIGSNCLFAIKVMDNEFLARRKKMARAQTERDILITLDHPFLPTLYSQFTSDNLSCLVMEYCPGGDLHVLRQKQPGRCFPEPAARFYVAEVLLALEYLHMLGIIYRDLKPENILVREDGHIMLTDFDLSLRCDVSPTLLPSSAANADPAKVSGPCTESNCIRPFCIEPYCKVSCFSPKILPAAANARKLKAEVAAHIRSLPQLVAEPTDARSNSFVGTHEYLAPEIIKGEGHGAAVDWWTFGIFLYELLYGKTPFKGSGNEETLANVVLQSLRFPDCPLVSFHARDLIRELLVKEPENRFGAERGAAEIKQHPFFEGLNWALIRCAIPPETPDAYDIGAPRIPMLEKSIKFLECKATGEHLEFELF